MRMLVRGGAGFIGAGLVHWTLANQRGAEATVLDLLRRAPTERRCSELRR